jgi:hypothetical protein
MQFALLLPHIPHATDGQVNTRPILSFVSAADRRSGLRLAVASLWTRIKPLIGSAD